MSASRSTRQTWRVAATADFNGDGKADIVWQNDNGHAATWMMNGNAPIAYARLSEVGPTWHVAAAADFHGDRKADLCQDGSGLAALSIMNGSTVTAHPTLSDVGSDWHLL